MNSSAELRSTDTLCIDLSPFSSSHQRSSAQYGGALYVATPHLMLLPSVFLFPQNSAYYGGALYVATNLSQGGDMSMLQVPLWGPTDANSWLLC